jgi:quercetin dioxygenase-like cupin family protein
MPGPSRCRALRRLCAGPAVILALYEHPEGVEAGGPGARVVYDLRRDEAMFGAASVAGPALVWELGGDGAGAALAAEVDPGLELIRCDRVDFPPGGVAYRHTHPGPGIRRLLCGSLTVETEGRSVTHGPGDAWFESGPAPVLATASATEATAFVRVLVLPGEWGGRRTIRYVDPADDEKPRLQRARVYLEEPLAR